MKASKKTLDWLQRYYTLVDDGQLDKSMLFFDENARLRFANHEPALGRGAIHSALGEGLLDHLSGIRHHLKDVWEEEGGVVIFEVDVTYIRKDDSEVTIPGVAVCVVEGELFQEQRIYVDISPVFA